MTFDLYLKDYRELLEKNKDLIFFSNLVRERIRKDRDCVIALTGTEGEGKSSTAIALGILFSGDDVCFDLEKNIAYLPDSDQIRTQFNSLPQYSTFIIDEAIKSLLSYEYMAQTMLIKLYATERYQNKISILCMPRFKNFTENFRNYRINIWVHIYERGTMLVCVKDPDKDCDDPWHVKSNQKEKLKKYKKMNIAERDLGKIYSVEERLPNFFMLIRKIPKLPSTIENEYKRLKLKSREIQEQEEETNKYSKMKARLDKYHIALKRASLFFRCQGYNDKIIAHDILNIQRETINKWINDFTSSHKEQETAFLSFLSEHPPQVTKQPLKEGDDTEYMKCNKPQTEKEPDNIKSKEYIPAPIPGIPGLDTGEEE